MKVNVDISENHTEPYAVIYTNRVTDEIQRLVDLLSVNESPITALKNEEHICQILRNIWVCKEARI